MCATLFSHLCWPSLQISTKQGGNSGSPVVHEETGEAIGVHTHGGCSETGGSNSGTRIDRPDFANHVAFLTAVCDSDAQCDAMSPGAERFLESAARPYLEKPVVPKDLRALAASISPET